MICASSEVYVSWFSEHFWYDFRICLSYCFSFCWYMVSCNSLYGGRLPYISEEQSNHMLNPLNQVTYSTDKWKHSNFVNNKMQALRFLKKTCRSFRLFWKNKSGALRLAGLAGLGLLSLFCVHDTYWNGTWRRFVSFHKRMSSISSVLKQIW